MTGLDDGALTGRKDCGSAVSARALVAVGTAAGSALALAAMVAALLAGGGVSVVPVAASAAGSGEVASHLAQRDIPQRYLTLYEGAAARYGLDWAVLAGIGKVECDHGRDPDPSCLQEGIVNGAGAGGPMQFIAPTWARYGVDGDGDGRVDRWDTADAVYSAARYLRASGAPRDYARALLAYNDARWYVTEVEAWAERYRRGQPVPALASTGTPAQGGAPDVALQRATPTPVRFIAGEHAELMPGDGHVALVPAGVPARVQAMLVAGNELQDLPYGPGGHPDPRGAREEDCSSTINYILYRAGVRPITEILRDNPLAQDYVHWGDPGPGRWVTIYATTSPDDHVFAVVAGLRIDTVRVGADVGPNSAQDGPRWRILDHIPTWAAWSIRHPPGL
jgi:hypothetical protein